MVYLNERHYNMPRQLHQSLTLLYIAVATCVVLVIIIHLKKIQMSDWLKTIR